ncbi:Nudix family hydrolase [Wenzhouxiangella sp. XN24]|nr:Nudix family hydrolase [Wenzhouxiangella sp. XN24]
MHVVAAVLARADGRVLIAQRPAGKPMAGAWEFPGGKLDPGEERFAGLARELDEELGVQVEAARPLIRYVHSYPERDVDLDTWRVTRWHGEPRGLEGQALDWRAPDTLAARDTLGAGDTLATMGLLPADAAIVSALRLPSLLSVTPPAAPDGEAAFLDALETAAGSAPLICLRRPDLEPAALLELAAGAACRIEDTGARLLLHGEPAALAPLLLEPPAALRARLGDAIAGLHVPARSLAGLSARPVPASLWFGASCHDAAELEAARSAGADYAFLGPVQPTASHPGAPGIGWPAFTAAVEPLAMPVYAIGGLGPQDLDEAWQGGAQGVAAIRGLWPGRPADS